MDVKILLLIIIALLTIANPVMAGNREGAVTLSPFSEHKGFRMERSISTLIGSGGSGVATTSPGISG
ncbi:MAG: hypothetical protein H6Q57_1719, partial [Geobacteraceae bacterium]|nr:hypothetical protein [Geobacteraceae bacterium]